MNPSLKDQLKAWKRMHQEPAPKKIRKVKKEQKLISEELTDADLRYLMGTNRPTYRKYRGSFRQR